MANLVEPGDKVLILVAGYFGQRLAEMARRAGGEVVVEEVAWGDTFPLTRVASLLEQHSPVVVGVVHAETSTGACQQSVDAIGALCRQRGAFLVLDTVTSLGGVPLFLDAWQVDAAYSCSQKCLGSPPGLSPVTFNARAMTKILARRQPVRCWYLDMALIVSYWKPSSNPSAGRTYHHTAPISANYGLYEALRLVELEGLEARWARHRQHAEALWAGLETIGLKPLVDKEKRLIPLTTVAIPGHVDASKIISILRDEYSIELSGGLGTLAGKVLRIGLMGYNARKENVALLLTALQQAVPVATKAQ